MTEIIPGILEKEWQKIEEKIRLVSSFAKTVHIDLLDGKFAENTSFMDPAPFAAFSQDITFELHMMVDDPLQYVKPFADAGFRRFLGHVERMPDQAAFVATAEQYGEVGLVVDAHTDIDMINVSYEDLDSILVMTVKAGYSGQQFLTSPLQKIEQLVKEHPFLTIEVDGGISEGTIRDAYAAGARRFVTTSALFSAPDIKSAYQHLGEVVAKSAEASVSPE